MPVERVPIFLTKLSTNDPIYRASKEIERPKYRVYFSHFSKVVRCFRVQPKRINLERRLNEQSEIANYRIKVCDHSIEAPPAATV
jgi:hypothetical protein